ncbi:tetratricopeptide repeat protein [Herbidospora sp. NBRC 101105]|uniref:tetratricopeptide repeat protein n=1 Tax=Herbidospora sp. NBRC 101105 TaxID=3032195 RepID=UPI0024A09214|nr:tetratricopeptide repeat protein [Herbidospora sp. NBRC 101105]GLX92956.1 hypothetical protein Hesp01_09060 [Herbidospora sp. NBRC 101105]
METHDLRPELSRHPVPDFTGREDALAELRSGPPVQVVAGPDGMGKTELLLQYVDRFAANHSLVWWIDGAGAVRIEEGLADLGRALLAAPTLEIAVPWALEWLRTHPGWLLVFDDVWDVAHVLAHVEGLPGGRVMITTAFDPGDLAAVPLGPLPVDRLGGNPLALALAGGLPDPAFAPEDGDPVRTVLRLVVDRIEELDPFAGRLLETLALLGRETVPRELLPATPEIDAGLRLLAGHRLITLHDGLIGVHEKIQLFVDAEVGAERRFQAFEKAVLWIGALLPDDPLVPLSWPDHRRIMPLARQVLPVTPRTWELNKRLVDREGAAAVVARREGVRRSVTRHGADDPETLSERHQHAIAMALAGHPAAGRDVCAEVLRICEGTVGPEDPLTVSIRQDLAMMIGEAGDPATARDMLAGLPALNTRIHGPDHPETLRSRHSLALWTGMAGDEVAAREQLTELAAVCERILGPYDPLTFTARHELAHWTEGAGDAARALDLYTWLLEDRRQILGPDHVKTLTTWFETARVTGVVGDHAGARDQFGLLLAERERVQGAEHPGTLRTRRAFAAWTGLAGDPVTARDLLAALLPVQTRVLGAGDPHVTATRESLEIWSEQALASGDGNPESPASGGQRRCPSIDA